MADLSAAVAAAKQAITKARMKRVNYQGIKLVIDRPAGFVQRGKNSEGTEWERTYLVDYGYINGTQGGDGEGVDVFLGTKADATSAFWIVQLHADGSFDEYKVMLGFADEAQARAMYHEHVPPQYYGGCATVSLEMMKALLGIEPVEVTKALHLFGELAHVLTRAGELPYVPRVMLEGLPDRQCKIAKAVDPESHFVFGIVLEPETVDSQEDIYSADEIRRSAHDYMIDYRNVGLQHKALINRGVKVVESFIAPVDFALHGSMVKAGTWLMGVRVLDEGIWKAIKSGELTGFSIAGFATKTPLR